MNFFFGPNCIIVPTLTIWCSKKNAKPADLVRHAIHLCLDGNVQEWGLHYLIIKLRIMLRLETRWKTREKNQNWQVLAKKGRGGNPGLWHHMHPLKISRWQQEVKLHYAKLHSFSLMHILKKAIYKKCKYNHNCLPAQWISVFSQMLFCMQMAQLKFAWCKSISLLYFSFTNMLPIMPTRTIYCSNCSFKVLFF